jgi:nifR3 family TIM-barrel protein
MVMAGAAQIVETFQPDVIDLNFGCPVPKVVKKGAGAALLKNLDSLEAISKAVVNAVSLPVTAKIRSGWDKNNIVVEDAANRIENAGVQAITVHPRTRSMGYTGKADWALIKKVKKNLTIPVIGNGDIWCSDDAFRMIEQTHCDFVMVARGAVRNPWIFKEVQYKQLGKQSVETFQTEWLDLVFEHLDLAKKYNGEQRSVKEMRKFLAFYLKGKPGASNIRRLIHTLNSIDEIKDILMDYYKANEGFFIKN